VSNELSPVVKNSEIVKMGHSTESFHGPNFTFFFSAEGYRAVSRSDERGSVTGRKKIKRKSSRCPNRPTQQITISSEARTDRFRVMQVESLSVYTVQ
jgi:hypothetical protein